MTPAVPDLFPAPLQGRLQPRVDLLAPVVDRLRAAVRGGHDQGRRHLHQLLLIEVLLQLSENDY